MQKLFSLLAIATLSACASSSITDTFDSRQNVGACPPAGSLYDAARIIEFEGGDGGSYNNIQYTGEITGVDLFCRYAAEDPVRAQVEINFAFGKGPKGTADRHEFTYWVAVTRRNSKVLNKEYFTVLADFGDDTLDAKTQMIDQITIPRADGSVSAANFEVIVGFDLTPDQLQFNREGRRFRLGAGN